jgi:hypothetical protein
MNFKNNHPGRNPVMYNAAGILLKFTETGSVVDKLHSDHPSTLEEVLKIVMAKVCIRAKQSVRYTSQETEKPKRTTH